MESFQLKIHVEFQKKKQEKRFHQDDYLFRDIKRWSNKMVNIP